MRLPTISLALLALSLTMLPLALATGGGIVRAGKGDKPALQGQAGEGKISPELSGILATARGWPPPSGGRPDRRVCCVPGDRRGATAGTNPNTDSDADRDTASGYRDAEPGPTDAEPDARSTDRNPDAHPADGDAEANSGA